MQFGRGVCRIASLAALFGLQALAWAPIALAEFHLVSIREVFPGSAAQPDAEYVQLQAYAPGQQFVAGHSVSFHDVSGATTGSQAFASDVGNGADQMTILLATPAAESAFGVLADEAMAQDLIDPAGGAVCWASLDCVAWGSFNGSLPSPPGAPAAPGGIPDGMALRRTIAPGCPTLLEGLDDRDDSARDLFAVFPGPRPNSVAPSERPCGDRPGAPIGSGSRGAPQTYLTRRPARATRDRTPTFRFAADDAGADFRCRLDRRPYRPCGSPFTFRRLPPGRHAFRVQARGADGQLDPTPALHRFRVLARRQS
jgi:hypothetical protein